MKIGFDAKRVYNNNTGLGHYSRTLVKNLAKFYPDNKYILFTPKTSNLFEINSGENINSVTPSTFLGKLFKSIWRGNWVKNDCNKLSIDLYHGLSHQIPIGIKSAGVKSVVTIHDLIFERYPKQHGKINVLIYRRKFKYACENADAIIAISEQTKNDLIDFYKVPQEKITVCYQTCNPAFANKCSEAELQKIKVKYNLPEKYFLSVGSITERKNLLTVCKALKALNNEIPLVVIGSGRKYEDKVKNYLQENNITSKVIFLNDSDMANDKDFKNSKDFPAIYQNASCFIYTSIFEGFGIPILEAMSSGVPVIASNVSCMPETGGDAALYVSPMDEMELANKIKLVVENENVAKEMIAKGYAQSQIFTAEKCTTAVMNVYKKILQ